MNKLTPFQEALLSSVNKEYANIPEEDELTDAPVFKSIPCHNSRRILRRSLIAAAVILVLAGSTFAAIRFGLQGKVDKSSCDAGDGMVDKFAISFEQAIANENAPDSIETYMLPAALSQEYISGGCYFEDEDNAFHPFWERSADNRPTDGKIQTVFVEWSVDDRQVCFTQQAAKSVKAGHPVLNYHVQQNIKHTISQEALQLGDYEVFCITSDFSEAFAGIEEPVCRMWFWTDGDYLYRLDCGVGFSYEEILEIFENLAPVEDISAYLGIG